MSTRPRATGEQRLLAATWVMQAFHREPLPLDGALSLLQPGARQLAFFRLLDIKLSSHSKPLCVWHQHGVCSCYPWGALAGV
jgi:hypothetical protein